LRHQQMVGSSACCHRIAARRFPTSVEKVYGNFTSLSQFSPANWKG
jgi:hypothetical protein